jgi:hypothetical protein
MHFKPWMKYGKLRIAWSVAFGMIFLVLIGLGLYVLGIKPANRAADYSAHAALTDEIHDQLSAVPRGQPYPNSLAEMMLTFPDGGDASLLKRYEYTSDGITCTLKTVLSWDDDHRKVIIRSYPDDAGVAFDALPTEH